MSIRHLTDIWSDPYFGQGDKVKLLVALSIADNARCEDGMAWPSLESIAKKARTSIRGAQEAIGILVKDGKLEIQVGKGPRGVNIYIVNPRKEFTPEHILQREPPHSVHPAQRAPRKPAPEKAPEKAAPVCTQTVRNHKEPSRKPSNIRKRARATLEELRQIATEQGMPASDGEAMFYKWEGNGWINGKNPIKSVSSTFASWRLHGYLPSQRSNGQPRETSEPYIPDRTDEIVDPLPGESNLDKLKAIWGEIQA